MNNNNVFSKKSIKNKTLMEETPYWDNTAKLVGGLVEEEDEEGKDEKGKPLKGLDLLKRIYGSSNQEPKGGKRTAKEIKKFIEASYNEKNPPKEIEGFLLDTELSNKTAKVYHNPTTGETVIAHRGTQGITDWGNNLAYVTGNYEKTDRYKKGKKNQKKAEAKYGAENISTLGHSQGAIIARKTGANTKEIIGVNPASLGEKPLENEYNVRTSGDLVSKMLPSGKNVTTIKSKTSNPLTEHSAKNLKQIKNQEIGAGIKISYNDMNQLKGGRRKALGYSADGIDWVNDGLLDDTTLGDDEMFGGDIFKDISKGAKSLGKKISKGSKKVGKDIGAVAKKGYQTINKTALKQDWGGYIETVKEPLLEVLEPAMSAAMETAGVPAPVADTISASAVGSAKAVNFGKSLKGQGQKALTGAIHGAITGAVGSMTGGDPEEGAGRRRRRMKGAGAVFGTERNEEDVLAEFSTNFINTLVARNYINAESRELASILAYNMLLESFENNDDETTLEVCNRILNVIPQEYLTGNPATPPIPNPNDLPGIAEGNMIWDDDIAVIHEEEKESDDDSVVSSYNYTDRRASDTSTIPEEYGEGAGRRRRMKGGAKIKSLLDISFDKLSARDKKKYMRAVNEGNVPPPTFPFKMGEREYLNNRTQYNRDKHPELYEGVPRLDGKGRKMKGGARPSNLTDDDEGRLYLSKGKWFVVIRGGNDEFVGFDNAGTGSTIGRQYNKRQALEKQQKKWIPYEGTIAQPPPPPYSFAFELNNIDNQIQDDINEGFVTSPEEHPLYQRGRQLVALLEKGHTGEEDEDEDEGVQFRNDEFNEEDVDEKEEDEEDEEETKKELENLKKLTLGKGRGRAGSRKSQIVSAIEAKSIKSAKKLIDLQKMKNPSKYLQKKYGHVELEEAHPSGEAKPKLIIKRKDGKVSVTRITINGVLYFKDPLTNKLYDPDTKEEVGTWNSGTKTIIPYEDEYEDDEEDEEEDIDLSQMTMNEFAKWINQKLGQSLWHGIKDPLGNWFAYKASPYDQTLLVRQNGEMLNFSKDEDDLTKEEDKLYKVIFNRIVKDLNSGANSDDFTSNSKLFKFIQDTFKSKAPVVAKEPVRQEKLKVRKQRGVKGARGKRGEQKTAKMTEEEKKASRKATLAKARAKTISLSSEIKDVVKAIPTMNYLELMDLKPTLIRFNNAERTKAEDNNLEKLKKAFNKRSEELKESNKGRTQGMALARARDTSDDDVIEGFGRKGKGLTNKIVKHFDKDNKEMIKLHRAFQKHMDTEEATE